MVMRDIGSFHCPENMGKFITVDKLISNPVVNTINFADLIE